MPFRAFLRRLFQDRQGDRVLEFLKTFEDRLKSADVENVRERIEHNEWAIGFDTMCTQLCEWNSPITQSELAELKSFIKGGPLGWEKFAYLKTF